MDEIISVNPFYIASKYSRIPAHTHTHTHTHTQHQSLLTCPAMSWYLNYLLTAS